MGTATTTTEKPSVQTESIKNQSDELEDDKISSEQDEEKDDDVPSSKDDALKKVRNGKDKTEEPRTGIVGFFQSFGGALGDLIGGDGISKREESRNGGGVLNESLQREENRNGKNAEGCNVLLKAFMPPFLYPDNC